MNIANIKRGLFLTWAVLTGIFVVTVAWTSFGDVSREFQRAAGDTITSFPAHPWWKLGSLVNFTIGLPLLIFIIGGGIFWVVEGFSGTPKRSDL